MKLTNIQFKPHINLQNNSPTINKSINQLDKKTDKIHTIYRSIPTSNIPHNSSNKLHAYSIIKNYNQTINNNQQYRYHYSLPNR